jgi:hypothetical protein
MDPTDPDPQHCRKGTVLERSDVKSKFKIDRDNEECREG